MVRLCVPGVLYVGLKLQRYVQTIGGLMRTWFSEERGEGTITPGSNGASGTVRPI